MIILILVILISFLAGIASGLLGIGGGLILVPAFYYLLNMNLHVAIGTSLAIIVPTALIGALKHASSGMVDWRIFLITIAFAVVGGFIGAAISMHLDVVLLRKMFAVFLVLVAIKMFFQ